MKRNKLVTAGLALGAFLILTSDRKGVPAPAYSQAANWKAYSDYAKSKNDASAFAEAYQYADAAIKLDPTQWEAHYEAARALWGLGRKHSAIWQMEMAGEYAPSDRKAFLDGVIKQFRGSDETPQWPAGSLRLFQDTLMYGATTTITDDKGRENKKSKTALDSDKAKFGGASLKLRMDPDVDTYLYLDFLGSWAGENLPYPGDLTEWREKGALVFWIRTKEPGASFDVGFRMRPRKLEDGTIQPIRDIPRTTIGMHRYCFLDTEWQKVVVPLADFYSVGYHWEPEYDQAGNPTDRVVRRERAFDWKSVQALVIECPRSPRGEQDFWLDEMVLVKSYDPEEAKTLKGLAVEKEKHARKSDDFVIYDDVPLQPFWAYPEIYSYVVLDETSFKLGKKSAKVTLDPKTWSGCGTNFPELDLTNIKVSGAIEYWVKGENGDEYWAHGLDSRSGGGSSGINSPDVRYYTDITTQWQKVSIPFADFTTRGGYWDPDARANRRSDFYWDRINEISWYIDPRPEKEYVFYLDDIRFVPRQTINMSKKVKEIKNATHDPTADQKN